MARPRQGVTLENASHVVAYFSKALKGSWRDSGGLLVEPSRQAEALAALGNIDQVSFCDVDRYRRAIDGGRDYLAEMASAGETAPDPDNLDAWVCEFVSPEGWRRCLNNWRQARHALRAKGKVSQVKIAFSTASGLKRLAKERGQTLDDLLAELLKRERGY